VTILPAPKRIRDVFADLLGRDVELTNAPEPVVPTLLQPCAVAVYVTDRVQTGALVCADLGLAARAGAALALIPPARADAAVEDRMLPHNLLENFHEVVNVFAGVFNVPTAPHVKLYAVHAPDQFPPRDVVAMLRRLTRRADYSLYIDGYGHGRLGVVLPM